jgi:HD-GYP domain-containing protein (c-di-GMP phosphodiesterase class II)
MGWRMDVVEKQVAVQQLRLGMYVNRLDRDWLGTPFPLQGFYVTSPEDIELLHEYCSDVFIDVERQALHVVDGLRPPSQVPRNESLRQSVQYTDSATLAEEAPRAREASDIACRVASQMLEDVRAGRKLSADVIKGAVVPVVESVLRNADAFFWISALLRRDSYIYSHAVNCSALAAALGRHMGFPEEILVSLATGGFLLDVGKAELPEEILNAPDQLEKEVFWSVKKHVESSLRIAGEAGILDHDVMEMIATHHERFDGSGYPNGMLRTKIPLFGRMAAVIDSFDAMTSHRAYQKAMSRHEALQHLYRGHDQLYQRDIVEQLLQCLGIYPTGTLVELSTGEVGIVMSQNQSRRLRPRLMLLLTRLKERFERYPELDLMTAEVDGSGNKIDIIGTPEPGTWGLDPTELYLV